MKKIFHLQQENKNPDRVVEALKHEIRKYMKRERKKKLPEDAVFWDFDCRFGLTGDETQRVSASEIITAIEKAHEEKWAQCYVEIIASASYKKKTDVIEDETLESEA